MPTLLGIHGSVTYPGRLHQALGLALESAAKRWPSVTTDLLHLGDHRISFADGRPLADFDDDTEAVVQRVMAADMYLLATPIFRASYTGALKNLFDLLPVEGLLGKVCGLVAMGASDHHYLAADTQLRPVLAWFGAHMPPVGVYLQSRQFQDGQLSDAKAIEELKTLGNAVIAMQRATSENREMQGPLPLAAS